MYTSREQHKQQHKPTHQLKGAGNSVASSLQQNRISTFNRKTQQQQRGTIKYFVTSKSKKNILLEIQ